MLKLLRLLVSLQKQLSVSHGLKSEFLISLNTSTVIKNRRKPHKSSTLSRLLMKKMPRMTFGSFIELSFTSMALKWIWFRKLNEKCVKFFYLWKLKFPLVPLLFPFEFPAASRFYVDSSGQKTSKRITSKMTSNNIALKISVEFTVFGDDHHSWKLSRFYCRTFFKVEHQSVMKQQQ